MTPQEARAYTLKEIAEWAQKNKVKGEESNYSTSLEQIKAMDEVIAYCEKLINDIKTYT